MTIFIPQKTTKANEKPQGIASEIDYSNRFSQNTQVISFIDNCPRLLSNNKELTLYGTEDLSSDGASLGVDSAYNVIDPSLSMDGNTTHTWAFVCTIHSFDVWGGIVGRNALSANAFFIQRYGSGDHVRLYINASSYNLYDFLIADLADNKEHRHVLTRDGTNLNWYIDGRLWNAFGSLSAAPLADAVTDQTIFGAERLATNYNAQSDWALFVQELGRAWTAEEVADWSESPYQLLKTSKTYAAIGASAPSPFNPAWAIRVNNLIGGFQ